MQWADLLTLQFLDLEGNLLDGNIPTQLGKLTELQSLFLERNNFNGPLPTDIARLTNLKQLLVYENQLTGHIPIQWRNGLVKLEVFWFHGNDLTGSVDDIFCLDPGEYPQFVEKDLQGDCSGDPPEIICSCCSKCCAFYGQDCRSQNV